MSNSQMPLRAMLIAMAKRKVKREPIDEPIDAHVWLAPASFGL
jgi:hypothetical protein